MSNITLTIPNDDHIALRAFGKALEEMALAHGAEPRKTTVGEMSHELNIDATEALERLRTTVTEHPHMEVDTTAQQVESLSSIKPFEERLELLNNALSKETPESLAEKLQSYDPEPTADSTGTPWDERIHSASKALNADGTWRLRRKPKDMDEAEWLQLVADVKLELSGEEIREAMDKAERGEANKGVTIISQEGVEVVTEELYSVADEPPVTPPGDDFHTDTGVVTEQTVAGIPPLPVPPPVVVPPAPVDDAWTFPKLMTFLTERQGKIDVATVNMLLAQDGITSLPELNAHPDKIGPFVARVKAHMGE